MKMYHNIEKSAFRSGYVGYGGGRVWHIVKTSRSDGNWVAHPQSGEDRGYVSIPAFTLEQMSQKLESVTP